MSARKFNFEEERDDTAAVAAAIEAKLQKMSQLAVKLVGDEKRWLRKKRLATTILKRITAARRRLRARYKALYKQQKENNQ